MTNVNYLSLLKKKIIPCSLIFYYKRKLTLVLPGFIILKLVLLGRPLSSSSEI